MTNKRDLFLQAVDVWMFRDGKPFDVGGGYRAESMFPPFPSTIQGALRSHELVLAGIDVKDQDAIEAHVGDAANTRNFKVMGTFIAQQEKDKVIVYLPVPANAAPEEGKGWRCLKPTEPKTGVLTSSKLPQLLWSEYDPVKHHDFGDWLSLEEWEKFWNNDEPVKGNAKDLFVRESRFGIAISGKSHTVEESQLYEAEFIRPVEDVGLLVETEGFTLSGWEKGLLRFGGEGHAATYQTLVNAPDWTPAPKPLPKKFAVCFITPTFFRGGWQPGNGDWSKFFDGNVNLVSAAFSRPHSVGGFDWAKFKRNPKDAEAHKPAKKYIPAGSVYFFENQSATALTKPFMADEGENFGFGRILIQECKS